MWCMIWFQPLGAFQGSEFLDCIARGITPIWLGTPSIYEYVEPRRPHPKHGQKTENDGHFLVHFHQFPKGSHFWDFELKTSFPLFSSSFSWERVNWSDLRDSEERNVLLTRWRFETPEEMMNIIQTLSSPEAAGVYPTIAMPPGVRVSEAVWRVSDWWETWSPHGFFSYSFIRKVDRFIWLSLCMKRLKRAKSFWCVFFLNGSVSQKSEILSSHRPLLTPHRSLLGPHLTCRRASWSMARACLWSGRETTSWAPWPWMSRGSYTAWCSTPSETIIETCFFFSLSFSLNSDVAISSSAAKICRRQVISTGARTLICGPCC